MKNLARAWRPTRFEDVVGQDVIIRLLRNSLYLDRIFPAYLLMGQRGCGKTTIGRVFAAALNCARYEDFRITPKESPLPCGICLSCEAMLTASHPDFIEIDAASHTGVDDIRVMAETTTLLPQLGRKRVYLIDEVHMLSKSASNALLKTLEEPPPAVVFMLATTDAHKIIDTVRSRCFPLAIRTHEQEAIVARLAKVCDHEDIVYAHEALRVIAASADGSLRDALNLLEQAILTYSRIQLDEVQALIGAVPSEVIVQLLGLLMHQREDDLVVFLQQDCILQLEVSLLWQRLTDGLHVLLWLSYGTVKRGWDMYEEQLRSFIAIPCVPRIIRYLEKLFQGEPILLKTAQQRAFLEMLLIALCRDECVTTSQIVVQGEGQKQPRTPVRVSNTVPVRVEKVEVQEVVVIEKLQDNIPVGEPISQMIWKKVRDKICNEYDQLHRSIVQQMSFPQVINETTWRSSLPAALKLWHEIVALIKQSAEDIIRKETQRSIVIEFHFIEEKKTVSVPVIRSQKRDGSDIVAAQDQEMMRQVLAVFPGTVTHLRGTS